MPEKKAFVRGENTKKKIEDAAMDLFAEYGFKGTSVRKIASEVGIRESALYNHFENKEAIFMAIVQRVFASPFAQQRSAEKMSELARQGKPFLQKFTTEFKLMTFDRKFEKLFRFMLIEIMQNQLVREGFKKEFHDANIKILSSGFFIMMQEGLIRSSDPMQLASAYLGEMFYLRMHVSMLKASGMATTAMSTAFEKQLEQFWTMVSIH